MPVAARDPGKFQHQGFGTLLMEEAERIAREEHGDHDDKYESGNDNSGEMKNILVVMICWKW